MIDLFKNIFESSPVALILVDISGVIQLVNSSAEKLFGYEKGELPGRDLGALVPEDIRTRHPAFVKSFFDDPSARKMGQGRRLRGLRKDGTKFSIEVGLTPVETEEGMLAMSSIIDVSQQEYAERRFRIAVDSAPNGMLMIDARGVILLVNKQIESMFEYSRNELLGSPIELLVPDDFKAHHPRFVANFVSNPTPRSMGIGRELFGRKKSGAQFPVEIGLQPLVERENSILVLASVVDITKRRNAEREIQEKSDELQEFAYRTSHDLKAPLSTFAALLHCIEEDILDDDRREALDNLGKLMKATKDLHSLLDSLLLLTKVDMESEESAPFDFESFAERTRLAHKARSDNPPVEVDCHFVHRREFVTSTSQMNRVLENLMSNAVKFSKPSGSGKVQIASYDDADFFYLRVSDEGLGIPQERHREVFTMFKRFHQGYEGHGIGLYLVRKIVKKLGGEISFQSDSGGSTFFLKFPWHQA